MQRYSKHGYPEDFIIENDGAMYSLFPKEDEKPMMILIARRFAEWLIVGLIAVALTVLYVDNAKALDLI